MTYIAKGVIAQYPKIHQPFRFDKQENKSVACGAFDEGAAYELSFNVPKDDPVAKEIWQYIVKHWKEFCAAKGKEIEMDTHPFKPHKDDPSIMVFKTVLKAAYGQEKTQLPAIFNAANQAISDPEFRLTSGSTVNVCFAGIPYEGRLGNGVSLRLRAVQVIELAEYEGGASPFSVDDDAMAKSMANMEVYSQPKTEKKKDPLPESFDDDIPF